MGGHSSSNLFEFVVGARQRMVLLARYLSGASFVVFYLRMLQQGVQRKFRLTTQQQNFVRSRARNAYIFVLRRFVEAASWIYCSNEGWCSCLLLGQTHFSCVDQRNHALPFQKNPASRGRGADWRRERRE